MSNVYFKRIEDKNYEKLSKAARDLFETVLANEDIVLERDVPLKVHFGEKGNNTYIPPGCYSDIIDYLKKNNIASSFIETNVLYRGQRTTTFNHLDLAKKHGFTMLPITIADGEFGDEFIDVEINKEYFSHCKIGKGFDKYNQFIVMSHFKGHGMAGFGGAIKQLAMGFASRGGKLAQHSSIKPVVRQKSCITCGLCVEKCDYDAIELDNVAFIVDERCVGCAGCIAVCPVGAINNDWNSTNFKERVTEYAYAAQLNKKNIYITYLINVTEECDCMGEHMHEIAKDIGVFASLDPVSVDVACLDMLQKESDSKLFESGRVSIEHANKIGFGDSNYNLIEIK